MYKYKNNQKKSKKKIIITSIVVCIILASAAGWFFIFNNSSDINTAKDTTTTEGEVNLDPPTEQDIKETEEFKKNLETGVDPNTTPSTTENTKANVVITNIQATTDSITASGYVSNVFEDGGNCKITLKLNGNTVSGESKGIADVNKTTCSTISIPRSKFTQNGEWTATLNYQSSTISGNSANKKVLIK